MRFAKRDGKGRRNNVVLIGAGASTTAGIPGAADIGRRLVSLVAERFDIVYEADAKAHEIYAILEAQKVLEDCRIPATSRSASPEDKDIDWWKVYDQIFKLYYTQPNDVRDLFGALVDEAKGAINWAHLVLGELVARGLVSTVLTTNFDQLALTGLARAGIIPVVCDGLESLNRIAGAPHHPQLIEIHGSRHSYLLRNSPADVSSVRGASPAIAAIRSLLQFAHALVVVGYGGREDGVMDLLVEAAEAYPFKHLYWVLHGGKIEALSAKARRFLSTTHNGGVLVDYDADRFFLELSKELGVGGPRSINDPLAALEQSLSEAQKARISHADIQAQVDEASRRLIALRGAEASISANETEAASREIRRRRLSGDFKGAYELAMRELRK
ncbi:hypothetical protein GGD63_007485 [Bradyrhizobium sp. cir1]|uniref:SIR2 family protein n=1 Tax=Bradyrhizobium sp. cir1 TaxID=1445730 RepID=UPI001606A321|nr:SIR2 family protein [Bradyrhizobium sp. cir1]MBB4374651.1 hypothetical protein [Bradyrhizobium sp. cir1]